MKKHLKKTVDLVQAAPDTVILAGDEASLYLQATLKDVWHPCGQTWHCGKPIQQILTAHPRLEILYLPTAAPDLNSQEMSGRRPARRSVTIIVMQNLTNWLTPLHST